MFFSSEAALADLRSGRIVEWKRLSPVLSLFRVIARRSSQFPDYEAGQYIALRRDDSVSREGEGR